MIDNETKACALQTMLFVTASNEGSPRKEINESPVNADGNKMQDGGSTAEDIKGYPRVTQTVTQAPALVVYLHLSTVQSCV